jgi:Tfp pilus assembly protein PilO
MQLYNLQGKISYKRVADLYNENPIISASTEVLLTIFAVSFMIFLALRPTLTTVAELRRKIDDQIEVNEKLDAKIKSLKVAQTSLSNNADTLPLYKIAVPDSPSLSLISKKIEILAQENNLIIDTFRIESIPILGNSLSLDVKNKDPEGILSQDQVVTLPLHINVEGNFASIEKFADQLESMDRLLKINSFSAEKEIRTGTDKSSYLSVSIEAEIYYKFLNNNREN